MTTSVIPRSRRVRGRDVFGEVFHIYRRRFRVVACVGVVLFAPLALLEAAAGTVIHDGLDNGSDGPRAGAVVVLLGVSLLMFGSALCAGFFDKLVGHEFGHEDVPFRVAARSLPYRTLIGLDVLTTVVVGVGAIAGLLPGLVVYTLACLAGPLVMIEGHGVRSALSRSAALTSRRIGLTLLVVALPVAFEHVVLHALEAWIGLGLLALFAVHAVAAVVVLVPVVLCEITLAYDLSGQRLIRRSARPTPKSQ